jgi:ParB/RepB/Spo0J family partition protein
MKEAKIELAGLRFSSNRAYGGEGEIKILTEDIKRNGLINPITVKPYIEDVDFQGQKDEVYEVIAGRRRVMAVKLLGWNEIPCRILEGDEIKNAEEIAGSENINRLAMHPLDESRLFAQLLENGRSVKELAQQYDRTASAIWQRIQLLSLSDGIKELFRDGKITLHAAAMLKSLDEEQQFAFYDKFKGGKSVSIWDVKEYISKVRHDKLYTIIAGKDCAGCKKRTFYNDKALFPELDGEDDLCLDHECYMEKWRKLLSGKIKKIKAGNKSHAEADIIACDDDNLAKIFGKSLTVDGTEYKIIKITWSNRPDDKPSKAANPCFRIDIEETYDDDDNETSSEFTCLPMFWKEPVKEKDQPKIQQKNPFLPMTKLLEMPEDEAKQNAAALWAEHKPKQTWESCQKADDIERKVKDIIFDKLIDIIVKRPDDDGDIDRFLITYLDRANNKDVIKKFAKSVKIPEIKKLSFPKMFAALYATTFNHIWALPNFDNIVEKKCIIANWAGVTGKQLKEMYKEELKALMPKTKLVDEKPEAKKPTAKKAAKKPNAKKSVKPASKKQTPAKRG